MVAAVKELLQARATADIKRADTLGRVELVAGKREQIELKLIHVDGKLPSRLHSVGMEINVGILGNAADFFDRLDGAQLVVGVHDGDERGFLANRAAQVFKVDQAVLVHVKIGDVHALLFERLASVKEIGRAHV